MVPESLPSLESLVRLAAFDVSSEKGGGSPGSNTLVDCEVVLVVDDEETSVELVASARVVVVVLLVARWVVEVLEDNLGNVDDVVASVVVTAPTTTVPCIPELWWTLQ